MVEAVDSLPLDASAIFVCTSATERRALATGRDFERPRIRRFRLIMEPLQGRARQFRDLRWFDEAVHRIGIGSPGELWFIAGNYRGTLNAARMRAEQNSAIIVAGPDLSAAVDEDTARLVDLGATAIGVTSPVAELIVKAAASGFEMSKDTKAHYTASSDLFGLLDEVVAGATIEGKIAVVLIDARQGEPSWNALFAQLTARRGRLQVQRLLVVVGLSSHTMAPDAVGAASPEALRSAADLCCDGRARWLWLPPLNVSDVETRLGTDAYASQRLITLSGGDDWLAHVQWERWVSSNALVLTDEGWTCGTDLDPVAVGIERAFDRRFGQDRDLSDGAGEALACAALLGDRFCCHTVAVVVAERLAIDVDAVTDLLDSLADDSAGPPLLSSVGFERAIGSTTDLYLWTYEFLDPAVANHFRSAVGSDLMVIGTALLDHLVKLRAAGGYFDDVIRDLARTVGDESVSAAAESRLFARTHARDLVRQALALEALSRQWDAPSLDLCEALVDVSVAMVNAQMRKPARAAAEASAALILRTIDPPRRMMSAVLEALGMAESADWDSRCVQTYRAGLGTQRLASGTPDTIEDNLVAVTSLNFCEARNFYSRVGDPDSQLAATASYFEKKYKVGSSIVIQGTARTRLLTGDLRAKTGDAAGAVEAYRGAVEAFLDLTRVAPGVSPLAQLARAWGSLGDGQYTLALAAFFAGSRDAQQLAEDAETSYREAVIIWQRLAEVNPDQVRSSIGHAMALYGTASSHLVAQGAGGDHKSYVCGTIEAAIEAIDYVIADNADPRAPGIRSLMRKQLEHVRDVGG